MNTITDDQIAEIEEAVSFPQTRSYTDVENGTVLALITRLREAERDAARYQFLRESGKFSPSAFGGWALNCGHTRAQPSLLDAAIDAAMMSAREAAE